MSIRFKLLLLAIGTQVLIALALVLNVLITASGDQLLVESSAFQKSADAAVLLEAEANKLATMGLKSQNDGFQKALAAYQTSVSTLAARQDLARNDTMKDALQAVARLQAGATAPFQKITDGVQELLKDFGTLGIPTSSDPPLNSIIVAAYSRAAGASEDAKNQAQFHVINLMRDLRNANDSLSTTVEVIQAKSAAVASAVGAIRTQSGLVALGLILVAFGLSIVLSLRSASSIARAVKSLSQTGAELAKGDLTHRFALGRRDEIGTLGQNLDQMLDDLSRSLQEIQAVASQNRAVRESLLAIAAESTSSAVEIDANSESIKNQMRRIDRMIEDNIVALGGTVTSINQFHERMSQQDSHISQSASAVSQMMASIENINRISDVNRRSAQDLVAESNGSREVFEQTFQTVAEVTENITEIREMAAVIAGIAGQTNILALNAAIEAAHAGEYGKGFAVVADEISKLAAASATNSDEIARTIATIVEKMQQANTTSVGALEAFSRISGRIQEVSDAISAIWSNVNEMHAGSQQILAAMESLKSTSRDMTGESAQIETSTKRIESSMDDLGKISREITVSVDEIAQGMRLISTSVQSLTSQSETMGELGAQLDEAVESFKTLSTEESQA